MSGNSAALNHQSYYGGSGQQSAASEVDGHLKGENFPPPGSSESPRDLRLQTTENQNLQGEDASQHPLQSLSRSGQRPAVVPNDSLLEQKSVQHSNTPTDQTTHGSNQDHLLPSTDRQMTVEELQKKKTPHPDSADHHPRENLTPAGLVGPAGLVAVDPAGRAVVDPAAAEAVAVVGGSPSGTTAAQPAAAGGTPEQDPISGGASASKNKKRGIKSKSDNSKNSVLKTNTNRNTKKTKVKKPNKSSTHSSNVRVSKNTHNSKEGDAKSEEKATGVNNISRKAPIPKLSTLPSLPSQRSLRMKAVRGGSTAHGRVIRFHDEDDDHAASETKTAPRQSVSRKQLKSGNGFNATTNSAVNTQTVSSGVNTTPLARSGPADSLVASPSTHTPAPPPGIPDISNTYVNQVVTGKRKSNDYSVDNTTKTDNTNTDPVKKRKSARSNAGARYSNWIEKWRTAGKRQ